jgi:hypothetical protein
MESGISTKWTDIFMRALTGVAVLMCAVGFVAPAYNLESGTVDWLAVFVGVGLSAACALCLLISNAMAANAPVVITEGKWLSGLICVACFVGGGLISMNAMHLGWEVFKTVIAGRYTLPSDPQMNFAFLFVAFAKPGINWVIHAMEEIKWNRKVAEDDKMRAEAERRADRMAESEGRAKRNLEAESRRRGIHVVPKVALAAAAATGIPAAAAAESVHFPMEEAARVSVESADTEAHAAHGWKGPRDQVKWNLFKEAVRRGMTNQKEIAETIGIPTTTAHRWWNAMHGSTPQAANA